jgi:hypothetical protein
VYPVSSVVDATGGSIDGWTDCHFLKKAQVGTGHKKITVFFFKMFSSYIYIYNAYIMNTEHFLRLQNQENLVFIF